MEKEATGEISYSGWKVNGDWKDFEERALYFQYAMTVEVLEEITGYRVE